jgi:cytochrome c biogenesis protein CcmG/thiol:disulfide interchange protein DsbE
VRTPVRIALAVLPLVALVALIAVFALNINRDPSFVQSVLINKPAPSFDLKPVAGLTQPGFSTDTLKGQVTVVNVFASWCIPCRDEHPVLSVLKQKSGVALYGMNEKDTPANAKAFLDELGNPFDAIGADSDGRTSIDWGVYGVPETFVVDRKGVIRYKFTGPMTEKAMESDLLPAIEKAKAET